MAERFLGRYESLPLESVQGAIQVSCADVEASRDKAAAAGLASRPRSSFKNSAPKERHKSAHGAKPWVEGTLALPPVSGHARLGQQSRGGRAVRFSPSWICLSIALTALQVGFTEPK